MCSEALDDGLISTNPALALGRWIGRRSDSPNDDDCPAAIRPFAEEELARLKEAARELCPSYYPLFLTLARTGCRPGEALALRWPDVDFEKREILIERAVSAGHVGPTKTSNRRRVDMSRELASVLRELCDQRSSEARQSSNGTADWIFLSGRGCRIDEDWPRKVFAKVLARAGLPKHTPYDLRHTFATLHLSKGHPITYVSAQLGHSDPSTTLKWYAHWLPTSDKRFADSLDGLSGSALKVV
jgi:integrase